jgi:hypothetical protein
VTYIGISGSNATEYFCGHYIQIRHFSWQFVTAEKISSRTPYENLTVLRRVQHP